MTIRAWLHGALRFQVLTPCMLSLNDWRTLRVWHAKEGAGLEHALFRSPPAELLECSHSLITRMLSHQCYVNAVNARPFVPEIDAEIERQTLQWFQDNGLASLDAEANQGGWLLTEQAILQMGPMQVLHKPSPVLKASTKSLRSRSTYELMLHLQAEGWTEHFRHRGFSKHEPVQPQPYKVGEHKRFWLHHARPDVCREYLLCLALAEEDPLKDLPAGIMHFKSKAFYTALLKGEPLPSDQHRGFHVSRINEHRAVPVKRGRGRRARRGRALAGAAPAGVGSHRLENEEAHQGEQESSRARGASESSSSAAPSDESVPSLPSDADAESGDSSLASSSSSTRSSSSSSSSSTQSSSSSSSTSRHGWLVGAKPAKLDVFEV